MNAHTRKAKEEAWRPCKQTRRRKRAPTFENGCGIRDGWSRADLPSRDHRGRCLPSTCGFTRAYTEQHSGRGGGWLERISPASRNVEQCPLAGFYARYSPTRRYSIILPPLKGSLAFFSGPKSLRRSLSPSFPTHPEKQGSSNFQIGRRYSNDIPTRRYRGGWALKCPL